MKKGQPEIPADLIIRNYRDTFGSVLVTPQAPLQPCSLELDIGW